MGRSESKTTPVVISGILYTDDDANGVVVDTHHWFMWLELEQKTFSYKEVTFRSEQRRNTRYWYAFKRRDGKVIKAYAGRSVTLNSARLRDVAAALHRDTLSDK